MATAIELGIGIRPRSAAPETIFSRVSNFLRREGSWRDASESSYLVQAAKYIPDFEKHRREHAVFLGALDRLTRIYRMPMEDIMKASQKNMSYQAATRRVLDYLTYEYLPYGYTASKVDDSKVTKTVVQRNLRAIANDPHLEEIADEDCRIDLMRRAGVSDEYIL